MISLLEDVAFLKQAYQDLQSDLQPNWSEPLAPEAKTKTEKKPSEVLIHSGESLGLENNLGASKQKSTCEAEESSDQEPSERLCELPRELDLVALIQPGENTEELTSELPESKIEPPKPGSQILKDDNSTSELDSESLSRLLLVESNNHGMTSVNSESPSELLSKSPDSDVRKDSLVAPRHLTGAALARRLNVSPSTLRHKKNARNFGQWTSGHDPDGIAWYFDGQQFISVLPQ